MTAESLEHYDYLNHETVAALGSLALPEQEGSSAKLLSELPAALSEAGTGARRIGIAATLIKERFQTLSAGLNADDRDAARSQSREASVRVLFKTFHMLPNDEAIDEQFGTVYRKTEAAIADTDRSRLADLAEIHENHPAIRVFNTLSATSSIAKDDIVFMRRTSLVLIDEQS